MTTLADVQAWKARTNNGAISLSDLEVIQPEMYDADLGGPARMWTPAARAMGALLYAARDDQHLIVVKYSYRTVAKQWEKYRNYQNGGTLAAYPGTSNHGDAITVDLTALDYGDLLWLNMNAGQFGFRDDVPGESWHWTYYGSRDFEPGFWEDDMGMEQYHEGQTRYQARYKENREKHPHQDPDPGPAPEEWAKEIRWGWVDARFAGQWPRPKP